VEQGLLNAGITLTSGRWLDRFRRAGKLANKKDKTLNLLDRMWSGLRILIDDLPIMEEEVSEAAQADTAIYVLRRNAGEGGDRKNEKGDYQLSDRERENLTLLGKRFAHTIVVLNSCVIDASFIDEAREALGDVPNKVLSIAGETSLQQLAALMHTATLLLTGDTGPLYLAEGAGLRTLSLWGPTHPDIYGPLTGGHTFILSPHSCTACCKTHCPHKTNACMNAIPPAVVHAKLCELLATDQ
jgi:hypothetical protein